MGYTPMITVLLQHIVLINNGRSNLQIHIYKMFKIEILNHKCIKIGLGYECNYLLVDRYSPYK